MTRPWIALALILTLPLAAHAASLDDIRTRGVLRVGVKTDAPPFGSLDGAGRHVGFEVDLARFFARVLFDDDRRAELVPVTTATRWSLLEAGRIDLVIATVTATPERRAQVELSEPYFMSGSLLLVPRGSAVSGLADLAERRLAVVRGSVHERDAAELQPRAHLHPVDSVEAAVQAVRSGQAAACLYDDVVILGLAHRDGGLAAVGRPLHPRPFAVAARKGETELIRWINGWLARSRRDGSYAAMWQRYFRPFESHLVGG